MEKVDKMGVSEAGVGAGPEGTDSEEEDLSMLNRFETEEEFCAAMSETNSLYFLMERRLIFSEASLQQGQVCADGGGTVVVMKQRGSGAQHLIDSTGGPVYDAAICLSRYIAGEEASSLLGKNVIELGAGPGLVSVIAARLVGESGYVLCTDGIDTTVELIAENLRDANGQTLTNAAAAKYWWGSEPEEVTARTWDYVVASDVAYDEEIFPFLLTGLRAVMKPGSIGLLCNGTRAPDVEKKLRRLLEAEFNLTVIDAGHLETSEELLSPLAEDEEGGSGPAANLKPERKRRMMPRKMNLWRITCKPT